MSQVTVSGSTSPKPRTWSALLRVGLALGSTLFTCALLEVALRVVHPIPLHSTDTYLAPISPDGAGPGAKAGAMLLVPGSEGRDTKPEFDVPVKINSHGLRDREFTYEKAPNTYRILVLGDSQTFGFGVHAEESYPKVLERLLRKESRRPVEVINTGVPGSGTAHQLFFLEHQGWKYQPDLVVVGYFFNDITNNSLCQLYNVRDGRLIRSAATSLREEDELWKQSDGKKGVIAYHLPKVSRPNPPFWIRHSHLARLVRQSISNVKQQSTQEVRTDRMANARKLTTHLLGEISRQCEERGIPCVVALLPSIRECIHRPDEDLAVRNADLLTQVKGPKTITFDLMPAFRKAGYQPLFYPQDEHFTAAGHQKVGELLAGKIRQVEKRFQ